MDRAFLSRSVSLLWVKHAFRVMTVTYLPSLCPDACTLPVVTVIIQHKSQKALCIWNFAFSWLNFHVFIDERLRSEWSHGMDKWQGSRHLSVLHYTYKGVHLTIIQ